MTDEHCGGCTSGLDLELCQYAVPVLVKVTEVVHGLAHCFVDFCADNQRKFFATAGDLLRIPWSAMSSHETWDVRTLQLHDVQ